jgi:hypothetical protein
VYISRYYLIHNYLNLCRVYSNTINAYNQAKELSFSNKELALCNISLEPSFD